MVQPPERMQRLHHGCTHPARLWGSRPPMQHHPAPTKKPARGRLVIAVAVDQGSPDLLGGTISRLRPPLRLAMPPFSARMVIAADVVSPRVGRSMPTSRRASVAVIHRHVACGELQSKPPEIFSSTGSAAMKEALCSLRASISPGVRKWASPPR